MFAVMTAATTSPDTENALRQYLLFLQDPSQLRDEKLIQQKTRAVLDADDPLDKLRALAELERVANIDEEPLREAFTEHAKRWADEQSVPATAFRELKVPDEVLREAGFSLPTRSRGRAAGERQRAKAVPVKDIKAHILEFKGTFILTDITNAVGGSQATVRKAVDELVETGAIEKLGPMPHYTGRGRAPIQYSRS